MRDRAGVTGSLDNTQARRERKQTVPKPYDATLKSMLEESPRDWPLLAGRSAGNVAVIDADVSTVSGAADKVLRVRGRPDWIMHVDFQAGPDRTLPRRLHGYNGLLEDRHDLLVWSVAVLLRPQANLSTINGLYERGFPDERPYLRFEYQVIRVWELPPDLLLKGGWGTLPLAPISAVTEDALPGVIERMRRRVRREMPPPRAAKLWTSTYILMGLRYPLPWVGELLEGVIAMEESVTYQAILTKGRLEGFRKLLLRLGQKHFGSPSARVKRAVEAINDADKLDELIFRVDEATSWDDLLGAPSTRSRRRK